MRLAEKSFSRAAPVGDLSKNSFIITLMVDSFLFPWHVFRASGLYVLDFIFPKRCLGCGRIGLPAGKAGKYFCQRCTSRIKIIEVNEAICPVCEKPAIDGATHPRCQTRYALDGLTSFFRYDGIIRKAVKSIKYRYVSDLALEFVSLIPLSSFNQVTKLLTNQLTILIPIPLHPSRQRFRGFNQAEVLGKILAQRLGIALCSTILFRTRATTPQVEMKDRKKRLENMKDVFSINHTTMQPFSNVILFDDVFTTGATMRAAANILKHSGAMFVWGVTMAR